MNGSERIKLKGKEKKRDLNRVYFILFFNKMTQIFSSKVFNKYLEKKVKIVGRKNKKTISINTL